MKHTFRLLQITLSLLVGLMLAAQENKTPDFVENDLEQYIEEALIKWDLPGVAVAIVKDGEVVLAEGFGLRNMEKKAKVNKNTLFMIASNTKAFTGTTLAWLEYEGKCDLNDKVVKWIPEFKMNDPWVTQQVTINDVLSHRLGLQTFQGDFLYFYSNLTKADIYEKFHTITPNYGFRERYGYCNAGFFWAGECIESITGEDWNVFIEENILEPLDMTQTKVLSIGIGKEKNQAVPHTLQDDVLTVFSHTNIDVIGPAASMSSSVRDMSHWLIAQLDSGRYNGKQVIPFDVIKNTWSPRISRGRSGHIFNSSHYSLYGLGWGMKDYEDVEVISHTGGLLGFVTGVSMIPEINLGVVVLTNTDANWFYEALKWEIIDAYLGLPFRDYSNEYHNIYQQRQETHTSNLQLYNDSVAMQNKPSLSLVNYSGIYENEIYGEVEVNIADGLLTLNLEHHPDLKATLQHIIDDRFLCSYYPSRMGTEVFPFEIKDGSVESFSLKVADRLEYGRYKFVKVK